MKKPVLVCWSGGKDSSMSLYELRRSEEFEPVALLTTVTEGYDRISMHGVRRELLHRQARAVGLPLEEVVISQGADNSEYERKMEELLLRFRSQGVRHVSFGDLFLEDIRAYREKNLARVEMTPIFPVWLRPTDAFARDFIGLGFKARLSCVDTRVLGADFAGRLLDEQFLADLPAGVDPCGENGEFHTFVFDGPVFSGPVECRVGEREMRDPFCFCDLVPV